MYVSKTKASFLAEQCKLLPYKRNAGPLFEASVAGKDFFVQTDYQMLRQMIYCFSGYAHGFAGGKRNTLVLSKTKDGFEIKVTFGKSMPRDYLKKAKKSLVKYPGQNHSLEWTSANNIAKALSAKVSQDAKGNLKIVVPSLELSVRGG